MSLIKLFLVIILNLIITIAEVLGGLISGSLSLISDALHNLSDTAAIASSYFSIKISRKPKNNTRTYGYKRANILSAFINSAALLGISIYLLIVAFRKFFRPSVVQSNTVIMVAIIGLLGNLFSVLLLSKSSKENINLKLSYLHLLSDLKK
ncbi:cadmium, cobalt and zinc/H(+)-K(+) antiporter domain protein [Clostridiales bacterium oral taxon 876 str. F0540]|nr:cadmium, cobalt and zinc/H(+)-K(+) antiporter domain protein [Clostridiales bacterium oral taxon 876 str. F0540]